MLATWALFSREVKRFYRDRGRIIGTLVTPLVLFAFVAGGFAEMSAEGERFDRYLLPGTLALSVMMTAIFSTISIIDDRKAGFLQGVLVAPVSREALVAAKVLAGATIAVLQATIVLVPLLLWQGEAALIVLPPTLLALLMTGAALTGLGFAIAWFSESTQGYHGVMNGLLMPMWALSGSLFPASGASPALQWLIRINPLSPFVTLLRATLHATSGEWLAPLGWMVAFLVLATVAATRSARAVMVASVLFFVACRSEAVAPQTSERELTFKALRFAQYEKGKPVFSATARSADGDLKAGLELSQVTVMHRGIQQIGAVSITAQRGVVGVDGSEPSAIEFSGGVVIQDEHGRTVTTEKALGTFADKHVSAPGAVRLKSAEINAEAQGIDGSLDTMEFTLKGPVHGTFDAEAARAVQPPR